ncbi:MAG: hypothetical protein RR873_07175, partial [Christensenella sp.]
MRSISGRARKVLALAGALSQSASLLRHCGFHHTPAQNILFFNGNAEHFGVRGACSPTGFGAAPQG